MFLPVKNNTGAVQPWEYVKAAPGVYQVGMYLAGNGETKKPATGNATLGSCICMTNAVLTEAGEIPVIHVDRETIFETTSAAALAIHDTCVISADSMGVAAGDGPFVVVGEIDGKYLVRLK